MRTWPSSALQVGLPPPSVAHRQLCPSRPEQHRQVGCFLRERRTALSPKGGAPRTPPVAQLGSQHRSSCALETCLSKTVKQLLEHKSGDSRQSLLSNSRGEQEQRRPDPQPVGGSKPREISSLTPSGDSAGLARCQYATPLSRNFKRRNCSFPEFSMYCVWAAGH